MPDREDDMSIAPLAERPSAEAPSAEADETGSPELEPLPSWVFPPKRASRPRISTDFEGSLRTRNSSMALSSS